jgi:RNA polymerase sigma-70 factor (ECF subfamily)
MTTRLRNGPIDHLRRAALRQGGVGDGQLLERFLSSRDEAAFELLVRRHGPLVLGVCRRVLGHQADAEDAFQATFLVLARRASSVVPRESVGAWLAGVARRTAHKAKLAAARRRERERRWGALHPPTVAAEAGDDRASLVIREVERLPEHYRLAVVLCDLEGLPRREAARRLGWPEGTLSGRLARARQLLARRLLRLGAPLSAGAVAALAEPAAAQVPVGLVSVTVRAAAQVAAGHPTAASVSPPVADLTEGVIQAMRFTKLKLAAVALLIVAVLGAGVGSLQPLGAGAAPPAATPKAPASDRDRFQGTWVGVELAHEGPAAPCREGLTLVFEGDRLLIPATNEVVGPTAIPVGFRLEPQRAPKWIDLSPPARGPNPGKTLPGIYAFDGDQLTLCFAAPGGQRPTEFEAPARSGRTLIVLRRSDDTLKYSRRIIPVQELVVPAGNSEELIYFLGGLKVLQDEVRLAPQKPAEDPGERAKREYASALKAYEEVLNQKGAGDEEVKRLVRELNRQVAVLHLERAVEKFKKAKDDAARKQALDDIEKAVKALKREMVSEDVRYLEYYRALQKLSKPD